MQAILAQPKRLALLAYLAIATPRGYHRRDKLLGLLWPEADEARARASLSRAIHFIRGAIGENVLINRGQEEVGLDSTRLWCDVAGFEDALDRGDVAEALALYRGPLLPGFFVDETPEFDRWLESERTRLEQRATDAARVLSEREEKAGRLVPAIDWTRKWAALAPRDESAVRRLMLLLEAGSDRAGAVSVYEEFAKNLEADLGLETAAGTRALYDTIRSRDVARPTTNVLSPIAERVSDTPTHPLPPAPPAAATSPRTRRGMFVAIGIVAGAALVWAATRGTMHASSSAPKSVMAIASFTSDFGITPAMDSVRAQLVKSLDTLPTMRAIVASGDRRSDGGAIEPTRARRTATRLRARFVVMGDVVTDGDRVTMEGRLYDSAGKPDPIARAAAEGVRGEMARMASDVAWQLAVVIAAGAKDLDPSGFPTRAMLSAAGVEGVAHGRVAYAAGRFDEAVRDYRHVVETDTGYALAYLSLSKAAHWVNDPALSEWASEMVVKRIARLTPLEQLEVRAWDAYLHARPLEAERLLRMVLANSPVDVDSRFTLGEVLYHWGPGLGWAREQARRAFTEVDSTAPVTNLGALIHLARIAGMDRDRVRVDSLVKRALNVSPDPTQVIELRALRAFAGTMAGDVPGVLAQLAKTDDRAAQDIVTLIAVSAPDNESSLRAIDVLGTPNRASSVRAAGDILLLSLADARGMAERAQDVASTRSLPPGRVLEFRSAFASLPFSNTPVDTLRSLRSALQALKPGAGGSLYIASADVMPYQRYYLLGMLSARLGDGAAATAYADTLEHAPGANRTDRELQIANARIIRATILHDAHNPADALAVLGAPVSSPDLVLPGLLRYPVAAERFLRAELLRQLGRDNEARRWYETFPDPGGYDLPYLAPALLRRAEIAARHGDAASAAVLRARANTVWRGVETRLVAWLNE